MTDNRATDFPSVDFWRSLRYFNLYRLTLAGIFVFIAGIFDSSLSLGTHDWKIFFVASLIYAMATVVSFALLKMQRPRFTMQLAGQVVVDIIGFTVLAYASGGIQSSIGLLLLVSLAAAGLISRGKITLFFVALASIAALLEHTYAVLYDGADAALYVQVGLLCMAYFAVAWLAHILAKYAVDSQLLAQRRGRDLISLSEANRLVMRDMQDGVLVVDGEGVVMQMNARAEKLLRKGISQDSALSETFPVLFGQYALWKQTGNTSRDTLQLDMGLQARLRFVSIKHNVKSGAVIFLEDMQRIRAEAQQIKLAALGRLTANIAHEVRNPLSSISYATELLQEEQADPRNLHLLQIVLDNTHRINRIIQDVMQLNRRDRAQTELFGLAAVLRSFAEEFDLAEQHAGVMELAGLTEEKISFDRGHLRQVLWNLCRNALRYGRKLPGSLVLTMAVEKERVMLSVQDDGPGINDEQSAKLFEPFFTTSPEGTGLGLYIAKELCEANGARLEYQGGENWTGACFCITFGNIHRDGEVHEHGG